MGEQKATETKTTQTVVSKKTAQAFDNRTVYQPHPLLKLQHQLGNQAVNSLIQAKLKVSTPADVYEEEADRIADLVMTSPQVQLKSSTEEEILPKTNPLILQKYTIDLKEEDKQTPGFDQQRIVNADIEDRIQSIRGGGQPLEENTRGFFENNLGYDLSAVKIHTDSQASDLANQLNAQAFTVGQDIFFGSGRYEPDSFQGKHLLAHELTHTIQQSPQILIQAQRDEAQSFEAPQLTNHKKAEHQQYELLAHDLVYKSKTELEALFKNPQKRDKNNSYNYEWLNNYELVFKTGENGFQAILLKVKNKGTGLVPILAIRGTEPENFYKSFKANNMHPITVGYAQFQKNIKIIEQLLQAGEKPNEKLVLTGHSLGGAVAQLITANYPGYIQKLITFQSPGIDKQTVEKFKKIPEKIRPQEIVHHIVKGDIADLAGEEHLPGQFFEHYLDTVAQSIHEVLESVPLSVFKNNIALYSFIIQLLLKGYRIYEAHSAFVLQNDSKVKEVKSTQTYDYPIQKIIVEELRQIGGKLIPEIVREYANQME